ncbi:hypothetical protein IFM89_026566 [Coptis chinensis]|uniref:Pentatricopeptide repeat-containing protein n=1 Tax=Coptis chinensis TaxID=261450 RepID=A0A835LNX5_9MAGN|nr:hypothetical protein IFM89_026566 [Coptis chinensis]
MISFKDTQPDILTFRALLKVCVDDYYPLGVQVHGWIVKCFGSCNVDLITSTYLINFYGQFGMVDFARNVFDEISVKDLDLFAFSSLMGCYNKAGMYDDVLKVLRYLMDIDGLILPNAYVLTCGLSACASLFSLFEGRQIHAYIVKGLLGSDVFVGTALINMYIKCNDVDCAKKSFLEIETPTVVAWNALMAGEFSGKEVLKLFEKMWGDSQIHNLVIKTIGVEVDVFIGGALFDIYVDNGCVSDAEKVLDAICEKDLTAYNLAIQGYRRNGHRQKAEQLFHEALHMDMELNEETLRSLLIRVQDLGEGKQLHALIMKLGFTGSRDSDLHISTSLVLMYAEFQCSDDAIQLFHQVHFPDLILWTSMISGFSISGESQKALDFLATVEEGKQIHAQIIKSDSNIKSDVFVNSGLVDMYSKCGYVTEAKLIFDKMPERDLPAWNAMITGLAQHGHAEMAIEVFQGLLNMPNIQPNHITFVGVLSACSYRGLVEEGYRYFKLIKEPTIDHYTCLIDLLGRQDASKKL